MRVDPYECFDPGLAQFPTRAVRLELVVDLLPISHAPEQIAAYRRAMERGDRFPPISVLRVGNRYFVADGHKRLSAYKALATREIVVELWTVRRWLADQATQLRKKTRQQMRLLWGSRRDPQARQAARRLIVDTVGHWRRIGHSLRLYLFHRAKVP